MSDPALGYGKVIRFSSQGNYDVKCMAPAGAPFVKQSKDQLLITLWLTGEDPPQRIMLRTEHDNEEMSVSMHKQRSQQQLASPHGVRRLISPADNPGGVTVSNCCGTIASVGLHRRASAECRRHDWSSLPSMYRISAHNGLRIRFLSDLP